MPHQHRCYVTELHTDYSAEKGEETSFLVTPNSKALSLPSEDVNCSRSRERVGPENTVVWSMWLILNPNHMLCTKVKMPSWWGSMVTIQVQWGAVTNESISQQSHPWKCWLNSLSRVHSVDALELLIISHLQTALTGQHRNVDVQISILRGIWENILDVGFKFEIGRFFLTLETPADNNFTTY